MGANYSFMYVSIGMHRGKLLQSKTNSSYYVLLEHTTTVKEYDLKEETKTDECCFITLGFSGLRRLGRRFVE